MNARILNTMILVTLLCLLVPSRAPAQSLLQNGDFSLANSQGSQSAFTYTSPNIGGGSQSGAAYWTTWGTQFVGQTVVTELKPSTFPYDSGKMLVVETDGVGGIVQVFAPFHEGPDEATACVWVYVEAGTGVCVGLGNGGDTHCSMNLTEKHKWERITVSNGVSPANELIIYSTGPSIFYVTYAAVFPGPSWDQSSCCTPEEFIGEY